MDDAAPVRVLQRLADLLGYLHRALGWDAMLLGFREQIFNAAAASILRDDERRPAFIPGVEDGDDMCVVTETAHRLRLASHADDAVGVEAVGLDQRESDIAIELRVVGEVDALLRAFAEKAAHGVAARCERCG